MDFRPGNLSLTRIYLMGFTNLGEKRPLLFLPFSVMLVSILTTNGVLVVVIFTSRKLHAPMYLLIGALSLLSFYSPLFFVPKMLYSFASNTYDFSVTECLVQMFFIHFHGLFNSSVLLEMAVDRYVAICFPLRYHDIVTLRSSAVFSVALALRNFVVMVVQSSFFASLTFCYSDVIYHCMCEQTSVVKLACGAVSRNYVASVVAFSVTSMDCACIACSYVVIFAVIFRTPSGESRQKAIHTCSTHLMVLGVSYGSVLVAFTGYRVSAVSPDLRVLASLMYMLLPCFFSPFIYGIRTAEIRVHLVKFVSRNRQK